MTALQDRLRRMASWWTPSSHILLWYLSSRLLLMIGGVLLTVVVLLTLIDFIDEVRYVNPEGYSFAQALQVIALGTPQRAYEVLPVCVFVGSLLGLGQLVADNEMTALRSTNFGARRLAPLLFGLGLVMAAVTIFIGEIVAPPGVEAGWDIKHAHQSQSHNSRGLWLREEQNFIHLRRGVGGDRINDILVYRLDEDQLLRRSLYARTAYFSEEGWQMQDVRESVLQEDGTVEQQHHAQQAAAFLPPPQVLELMLLPANEMSLMRLHRYLQYFADAPLDLRAYRFARWQRIATPLSCIVVLLLTLPFALTQSRGGGLGQHIFVGVISGIGIYVFNRIFAHLGMVLGYPAWVAAFLPLVLLLLLAAGILVLRQFNPLRRVTARWRSMRHASIVAGR